MNPQHIRDYAIAFAAIVFGVSSIFSIYFNYHFFKSAEPTVLEGELSFYTDCEKLEDGFTLQQFICSVLNSRFR